MMEHRKLHKAVKNRGGRLFAVLTLATLSALSALARSAYDFDVRHMPLFYITRSTSGTYANALTNSSATTWLGASGRIEISVTLQNTANQVIFAQGSSNNSTSWELLVVNNKWRLRYGNQLPEATYANNYAFLSNPAPAANTKYDIVCERKDGKLYLTINDVACIQGQAVGELGRSEGLTFFHRKSGSSWNNCASTMKFHYARIYNDGELEAEFLPAVINVFGCGLYDTQGGTPEDVSAGVGFDWNERAEKIHEKFCNEGLDEGGVEVDWVETMYGVDSVQTDFVPDSSDIVRAKFMLETPTKNQVIFSAGGLSNADGAQVKGMTLLCHENGKWRADFAGTTGTAGGAWTTNVDYEVEYSAAAGVTVNGSQVCTVPGGSASFTPTYGITFFVRMFLNGSSSNALDPLNCPAHCRLYWMKVYASDGTTLKADFVPYVDGNGYSGIKEKLSGKVFLPLFGSLSASTGARPKTVYASPDAYGDDTNAGTFRSPVKNLRTAVNRAAAAGTVYLKDGTYAYSYPTIFLENDTAHSVIGLSGDASKVIIRGARDCRVFVSRNQSNAVLKNFTISNCVMTASGGAIFAQNALIENCVFVSNAVSNVADGINGGGAIYANGCTIRRCVFKGNQSLGDRALGSALLLLGNSTVENCLFEGNVADDGEAASGRCCTIYVGDGSTAKIRNCTLVKNRAQTQAEESTSGIRVESASASVVNTVFCGNEHNLGASLKHSVARFNSGSMSFSQFSNCAADYAIGGGNRTIGGDGSVFADWANGDYALHGKSRLVNRGAAYLGDGVLPEQYGTDLLGNPRYVGEGIDIGAYEWQGADPHFGMTIMIK